MPIFEVTSKPADGVRKWTEDDGTEREAIRVTTLEAEDDAEAKVRVNDLNRDVVRAAEDARDRGESFREADLEAFKVTKVREV